MCPWEAPLQAAGCESLCQAPSSKPVPGVQGMGTSGSLTQSANSYLHYREYPGGEGESLANVSSISDPHSGHSSLPRLMIQGKMCVALGWSQNYEGFRKPVGGSAHLPLRKSLKSVQLQSVPTGRAVAFLVSRPWKMYFGENIERSLKNRSPETTDASLLLVREAVLLAPVGVS